MALGHALHNLETSAATTTPSTRQKMGLAVIQIIRNGLLIGFSGVILAGAFMLTWGRHVTWTSPLVLTTVGVSILAMILLYGVCSMLYQYSLRIYGFDDIAPTVRLEELDFIASPHSDENPSDKSVIISDPAPSLPAITLSAPTSLELARSPLNAYRQWMADLLALQQTAEPPVDLPQSTDTDEFDLQDFASPATRAVLSHEVLSHAVLSPASDEDETTFGHWQDDDAALDFLFTAQAKPTEANEGTPSLESKTHSSHQTTEKKTADAFESPSENFPSPDWIIPVEVNEAHQMIMTLIQDLQEKEQELHQLKRVLGQAEPLTNPSEFEPLVANEIIEPQSMSNLLANPSISATVDLTTLTPKPLKATTNPILEVGPRSKATPKNDSEALATPPKRTPPHLKQKLLSHYRRFQQAHALPPLQNRSYSPQEFQRFVQR